MAQVVSVRHRGGWLAEVLVKRQVSEDMAVLLASEALHKEGCVGWQIYAVRPQGAPASRLAAHWKAVA